MGWEKVLANYISDKDLVSRIYKELLGLNYKKMNIQFKDGQRISRASLVAQMVKNLAAMQETQVGKILWRREWQPPPVFLPGKSHGQRTLVSYSPRLTKSQTQLSN